MIGLVLAVDCAAVRQPDQGANGSHLPTRIDALVRQVVRRRDQTADDGAQWHRPGGLVRSLVRQPDHDVAEVPAP